MPTSAIHPIPPSNPTPAIVDEIVAQPGIQCVQRRDFDLMKLSVHQLGDRVCLRQQPVIVIQSLLVIPPFDPSVEEVGCVR